MEEKGPPGGGVVGWEEAGEDRSTNWAPAAASRPESAPSIKAGPDISTICNAPRLPPAELPKWASPDPSGPHSGLRCRPRDGWPLVTPPPPRARLTTAGETWAGRGVKPRAATATQAPRPRDPVFPAAAAGDARAREIEPGEQERRTFQVYKEKMKKKKKTHPKPKKNPKNPTLSCRPRSSKTSKNLQRGAKSPARGSDTACSDPSVFSHACALEEPLKWKTS